MLKCIAPMPPVAVPRPPSSPQCGSRPHPTHPTTSPLTPIPLPPPPLSLAPTPPPPCPPYLRRNGRHIHAVPNPTCTPRLHACRNPKRQPTPLPSPLSPVIMLAVRENNRARTVNGRHTCSTQANMCPASARLSQSEKTNKNNAFWCRHQLRCSRRRLGRKLCQKCQIARLHCCHHPCMTE